MRIGGVRIEDWLAAGRAGGAERLPLRWAIVVIGGLAALGWAAVLIPLALLLR